MTTAFQFFAAYLIVDVLCIALTVVIASNVSRDSGSETQVRYFFLVLSSFLVFSIFDAVWAFVAYSGLVDAGEVVLAVVNGINLTAIGFAAYFWLCFTLARFNSKITDNRSLRLLAAIPACLVPVIHVVGFFTGQNIVTLPDGMWTYGICHLLITCVQLSYIVAATVIAAYRHRHATTRAERHLSLVFISFMVPFVIAGVVDSIIINTPIATACIMVSLTFVMMSMQESRISSDALTGLNNRRRADAFLEDSMEHASAEHPLYLFIIDLDDFKSINDTYGHLEGDHALKLMANALRTACSQANAFAARWGGDEFVVICPDMGENDPSRISALIEGSLTDMVNTAHLKYNLVCSVGYASCESPTEGCAQLISEADNMLYRVKRAHNKGR